MNRMSVWIMVVAVVSRAASAVIADDAEIRASAARAFHARAQERTGVLVPMYVYPANIHTNADYNRLMELKRRFETVPFWVIVNPASGPGQRIDANYTKAIDRLLGSGCVVLGYVSTSYGKRTAAEVTQDIEQWRRLYPRTQGIFFDEMNYEDTTAAVEQQLALNDHAHRAGFWPTVANPGAATPERYFAREAADVLVVHESDRWPEMKTLHGDYFGGYADYPPFTRALLLHSQPELDKGKVANARQFVRWIYVTDDPFRINDPRADNPWDTLSKHLEALCTELSK